MGSLPAVDLSGAASQQLSMVRTYKQHYRSDWICFWCDLIQQGVLSVRQVNLHKGQRCISRASL